MKLQVSTKTSSYGDRPKIRKGYYPVKLVDVKQFTDADGNLKEKVLKNSSIGYQLIFDFEVYSSDDKGNPIAPLKFKANKDSDEESIVKLSQFVFFKYKEKNKETGDMEEQSGITPKSGITKTLVSLGWTFNKEDVDPMEYVGKFAEANIDDYTSTKNDVETTFSVIKEIGELNIESDTKVEEPVTRADVPEDTKEKVEAKIAELKQMNKDGTLSDAGLATSLEQYELKLKSFE